MIFCEMHKWLLQIIMIIATISNAIIQDKTTTAVKRVEHDAAVILISAFAVNISVIDGITPVFRARKTKIMQSNYIKSSNLPKLSNQSI